MTEGKRRGKRLSTREVQNAKKDLCDGDGLWLQVSNKFGTRAWIYRYMVDGVSHKMGLGSARTVTLAEARKRADGARLKLYEGADPIAERMAARVQQKLKAARTMTFKQCADRYIDENRASWKNEKHGDQWFASFNQTKRGKKVFPAATQAINDLPVSEIDTALMLQVLEPIWTKTPESASRIRARIERVLGWATVRGHRSGENPARWRGHLKEALASRSVENAIKHYDALPYVEIPAFMAELRGKKGVAARALEFTILTAARTGEVIGAKWSELDLRTKLWTIPAERMKSGREHRVPISDRALEVLSALPREGDFVFVARANSAISQMAMLERVRKMRGKGATVHGFRSTFRDWAAEQTAYPNELCEIALAHAVGDKTEKAYRRGDMMEKRRRLMADWAAFCEQPASQRDNVVSIRELA